MYFVRPDPEQSCPLSQEPFLQGFPSHLGGSKGTPYLGMTKMLRKVIMAFPVTLEQIFRFSDWMGFRARTKMDLV